MARKQARKEETEASLIDRRTFIQAAGVAVASAATVGATSGTASAATTGFGAGGYGTIGYGTSMMEPDPTTAPSIDSFSLTESEPLGANRQLVVKWSVSDTDGDLRTVEVTAVGDKRPLNFDVNGASGSSDSGWKIFRFKRNTTTNVTLRVTDEAGNVTTRSKSVDL